MVVHEYDGIKTDDTIDINIFKKKNQTSAENKDNKAKSNTNIGVIPVIMQTITEDEEEYEKDQRQTDCCASSSSSKTSTDDTASISDGSCSSSNDVNWVLEEIQKLARIQAKFEIDSRDLPKEEKVMLEKERIERLRFLANEQLKVHSLAG